MFRHIDCKKNSSKLFKILTKVRKVSTYSDTYMYTFVLSWIFIRISQCFKIFRQDQTSSDLYKIVSFSVQLFCTEEKYRKVQNVSNLSNNSNLSNISTLSNIRNLSIILVI